MGRRTILILSYFFPPCNLPAAQRAWGWAKYFGESGLHPVIVTRNWDHPVTTAEDVVRPGGDRVTHQVADGFEAFYLPHRGSVRDRIYCGFRGRRLQALSKAFTLAELLGQHALDILTPLRYLRDFARDYLRAEPDVADLVVSGGPFVLFKFGAELKREFSRLRWVADYRDDWSTSRLVAPDGLLPSFLRRVERRSERHWLSSAAFITSVSPAHTRAISDLVERPGHTIYNGFDFEELPEVRQDPAVFRVVYSGALYPTQRVEDLVGAVLELATENPDLPLRLMFPGLEFDKGQAARVKRLLRGREDLLETAERIPRSEVIRIQLRAHVLIMLSHPGVKGIASSKMFEYLGLGRPILVYPNDHDVLEALIAETHAGFVCDDTAGLKDRLSLLAQQFRQGGETSVDRVEERVSVYSRKHQARLFAGLLAGA